MVLVQSKGAKAENSYTCSIRSQKQVHTYCETKEKHTRRERCFGREKSQARLFFVYAWTVSVRSPKTVECVDCFCGHTHPYYCIVDRQDTDTYVYIHYTSIYLVYIYFFSHPMNYLRLFFFSLPPTAVITQIRGHIAGSSPLLPTMVRAFAFLSREDVSAFFPRRLASNCAYPRY